MKSLRITLCVAAILAVVACSGGNMLTASNSSTGADSTSSATEPLIAHFSRFPAPEQPEGGIVIGSDNAVYLNGVHHFMKFSGTFKTFAYPRYSNEEVSAYGDAVNALSKGAGTGVGSGGMVWTLLAHSDPYAPADFSAGRLSVRTARVAQSEVLATAPQGDLISVYWGGDNNMWISDFGIEDGYIGGILVLNSAMAFVGSANTPNNDVVDAITKGPDGAMYAASDPALERGIASQIFRYDSASKTLMNTFTLPPGSQVEQIARGPDNALWFTDSGLNEIGRLTTYGSVAYYKVPTSSAGLTGITLASDHALWFTETNANKIGRIVTNGSVTEYSIPSPGSQPLGITAVPSGSHAALYFSEANALGKLTF